ncbi:methyltransferase domain-containing protein [bacterium]|nr:methyltransferase domain-containing protein [bacterium]
MFNKRLNLFQIWNSKAKRYDEFLTKEGDVYQQEVNWPALKGLIGDVSGKTVLDAGCGNGLYTQLLHTMGAQVSGIDIASSLTEIAQTRYPEIFFDIGDLTNDLPYQTNTFDLVFSKMVLMDIPSIENTVAEFYRVLKPQGVCVISILHPFYPLYYMFKNKWTSEPTGKFENVKQYHDETFTTAFYKHIKLEIPVWTRSLEHYINTFTKRGFGVKEINEPKMSSDFLEKYPEYQERSEIPIILNIKYIKHV